MAGLEPVINAFAVEGVHAPGGVAYEHPVGPGNTTNCSAHRQHRRPCRAEFAVEFPVLALLVGVVIGELTEVDLGRVLVGREGAYADIHVAVAEWENPAVPAEKFVLGAAKFEVAGDPGVVAAAGGDVRAGGDTVGRAAVPFAAKHSSKLAPHTVGDDQPVAVNSRGVLLCIREHNSGDSTTLVAIDIGGAQAFDGRHAGFEGDFADGVIKLEPRRGRAVVR